MTELTAEQRVAAARSARAYARQIVRELDEYTPEFTIKYLVLANAIAEVLLDHLGDRGDEVITQGVAQTCDALMVSVVAARHARRHSA